jgi:DNA processing protein
MAPGGSAWRLEGTNLLRAAVSLAVAERQEQGLAAGSEWEESVARWVKILADLQASDPLVGVLTTVHPSYPARLRDLALPPPFLFVRGSLQPADDRAITLIGTRQASQAGRARARDMASQLASVGWTVVSGLAVGIDAEAHRGALAGGGRTLAVVGTGVLTTYPPQHTDLAAQVARAGGVLSPFLPSTPPSASTFRSRDRLASALGSATAVVEAGPWGGARFTARLASELGRPLLLASTLATTQDWARALVASGRARVADTAEQVLQCLASWPGASGPSGIGPIPTPPCPPSGPRQPRLL